MPRVFKGLLALLVFRVFKASKVLLESLGLRDLRAFRVQLEFKESKDRRDL